MRGHQTSLKASISSLFYLFSSSPVAVIVQISKPRPLDESQHPVRWPPLHFAASRLARKVKKRKKRVYQLQSEATEKEERGAFLLLTGRRLSPLFSSLPPYFFFYSFLALHVTPCHASASPRRTVSALCTRSSRWVASLSNIPLHSGQRHASSFYYRAFHSDILLVSSSS